MDPERSARESSRRAATAIRRWAVHHRASRLGTLTYRGEGCHSVDEGWRHVEAFRRALRQAYPDAAVLVVPEWHPGGHGVHWHFLLSRYVPHATLVRCWGRGFVDIRRKSRGKVRGGARQQARTAAGYVAKYVAKSAGVVAFNRRRYSIPKGTRPTAVRFVSLSLRAALDDARQLCGVELAVVWRSSDAEDWRGPPTLLAFGGG